VGRRVGVVLTGGTIGCDVEETGAGGKLVRLRDGDEERAPELELVREAAGGAGLEFSVRRPLRLTSENMAPGDWTKVAAAARELVSDERVDAVLVLHGTDTMAYTSAALSFMLSDLEVPIVLTGAGRPTGQPGSDAAKNVSDSLVALGELGPGVCVVFAGRPTAAGRVHLGTRVREVGSSRSLFASVGCRPVAEVREGRFVRIWTPGPPVPEHAHLEVDARVLSLRLYPGLDLRAMFEAIAPAKTRGVVLELYPSITGPGGRSRFSVPEFVERCTAKGIPVVATVAAAPTGRPTPYESTIAIEAAGAEILPMLPETATVKMMWALGARRKRESVLELMRSPVAGELHRD
jgi:L-asparaginase/Glu-tRNA(Gln) amidotransferase subunit D